MKQKRLISALMGLVILASLAFSAPLAFAEEKKTSVYEGVDYSAVYDYDFYTRRYPEVYSCFGGDDEATLAYFVEYGMDKGHKGNSSFDVESYKNRYQDLRIQYGDDLKSYYMHYVYEGKAELRQSSGVSILQNPVTVLGGVDYSPVYNYNYYISHNYSVAQCFGGDDLAVLKHFVNYGMEAGLAASAEFNVQSYRNLHQDLRLKYGNELKNYYMHYIYSGMEEGRSTADAPVITEPVTSFGGVELSSIYDFNYYVANNLEAAELYKKDDVGAIKHFVEKSMPLGLPGAAVYDTEEYERLRDEMNLGYDKARKLLDEIGWNLKAAYRWAVDIKYYGHNADMPETPDVGMEWYADFGFDNSKGNCYVKAAAFCEMARLLGYEARQMSGTVPQKGGTEGPHSWVEIDIDGTTYVVDPVFETDAGRNGYLIAYGQSGTWRYNNGEVME